MRPPAHYNPRPMFGLRTSDDASRAMWRRIRRTVATVRGIIDDPWKPRGPDTFAATRRWHRFIGTHVQIDGWGYP